VNCYPVIFCGRSFVAPTRGMAMVYDGWPPLPGMKSTPQVSAHGSDTAAMLIWDVPVGFIESRSIWEHGEIPLWNRYGHAGYTLIGQAISMLGDPLQAIVILGHGSALAWDIKFLLAKFVFCAGFGLLVLRLFGSRPLSLLYAALAAYCGVFFFIYDHPVYFVFCYAPWILLSALEMLDKGSVKFIRWGIVWLLANFACFNAGHVETAVVLIGGLNLAAVALTLVSCRVFNEVAKILARLAGGTMLFLGLTAPVWMSFLATLGNSYSVHTEAQVTQLPFVCFIGVFDDYFFRLPLKSDSLAAVAPATSLLIMVGGLLSVVKWRRWKREPFFWVNSVAIVLWSGCIFGWVPAAALLAIPLLNRVDHLYTDFSYLLAIHLTLQSVFGFKSLVDEKNFRRAAMAFVWTGLIAVGMLLLFCLGIWHRPVPWTYFVCAATGAFGAPLLFAFLKSRGPISTAGWLAIIVLGFLPQFRFGYYTFGDDKMLMLPGPRVVLNAPSPAIEKIQADTSGPFRVIGAGRILFGNYAAVYGLEDIRSCAPLSSSQFIQLVQNFPGMEFGRGWMINLANPVAAHPLLNLLNVKYLLTPPEVPVPAGLGFRAVYRSDLAVVENPEAWPRAFFTDKVISISSDEEFNQYLLKNGNEPFAALAPDEFEQQPALRQLETTKQATVASATNYQLLPNSTAFDVRASSAGIACLTEGRANNFSVTVNGEAGKVLTVNRAFKGVYLDKPGDYHINFIYRPGHWRLACILFWIALALVAMLAAADFIASKIKPEPIRAT